MTNLLELSPSCPLCRRLANDLPRDPRNSRFVSIEGARHCAQHDVKQCPVCLTTFKRYGKTKARPYGRSRCRNCDRWGPAAEVQTGAPKRGRVR